MLSCTEDYASFVLSITVQEFLFGEVLGSGRRGRMNRNVARVGVHQSVEKEPFAWTP